MKLDLVLTTEAVGRMATEEVVGLVMIDDEGIELVVLHRSGLSQILPVIDANNKRIFSDLKKAGLLNP